MSEGTNGCGQGLNEIAAQLRGMAVATENVPLGDALRMLAHQIDGYALNYGALQEQVQDIGQKLTLATSLSNNTDLREELAVSPETAEAIAEAKENGFMDESTHPLYQSAASEESAHD